MGEIEMLQRENKRLKYMQSMNETIKNLEEQIMRLQRENKQYLNLMEITNKKSKSKDDKIMELETKLAENESLCHELRTEFNKNLEAAQNEIIALKKQMNATEDSQTTENTQNSNITQYEQEQISDVLMEDETENKDKNDDEKTAPEQKQNDDVNNDGKSQSPEWWQCDNCGLDFE